MDLKATYNKIAEDWHKDHQRDDWWVVGTDKFISSLKPGASVLDAGCGGGTKSRYLISKGLKVTGTDFSQAMVDICKREVPEGEFFTLDLRDTDKLDRTFDGIFAQASLLHIPKKEIPTVMQRLYNQLNVDGYLYAAVKEIRLGQKDEEVKIDTDYDKPVEIFYSYFSLEEMKKHMTDLGMEIVYESVNPSGRTNWIQVIGRKK